MNLAKFKTDEEVKPSFAEKLDAHQVKIQLVTIYAGLLGIVLEGVNAFDYMTGLRLALISPNAAIVTILFFLTFVKGKKSFIFMAFK